MERICGHCGYRTKGLPTRVCPECGANLDEVEINRPQRGRNEIRRTMLTLLAVGVPLALCVFIDRWVGGNKQRAIVTREMRFAFRSPTSGAFGTLTATLKHRATLMPGQSVARRRWDEIEFQVRSRKLETSPRLTATQMAYSRETFERLIDWFREQGLSTDHSVQAELLFVSERVQESWDAGPRIVRVPADHGSAISVHPAERLTGPAFAADGGRKVFDQVAFTSTYGVRPVGGFLRLHRVLWFCVIGYLIWRIWVREPRDPVKAGDTD